MNYNYNNNTAEEKKSKDQGILGSFTRSAVAKYKYVKKMFEKTKLSYCVVAPAEDDSDALRLNQHALNSLINHSHDMVSLVGPPGVGKSTLASALYNVMRGDVNNYFEISGDSMESFTRGIWVLNETSKVNKAIWDRIDVLDLEGIEDEDVIHYLVVVAMSLSKAMLLCANYKGGPRFLFSMLKILESGVRLFKQYNIRVPKPVIYIQVPFGATQFKISRRNLDANGLFAHIKNKYRMLAGFEIRIFSLPIFAKNRFEYKYQSAVKSLIRDITKIDEKVRVEVRVGYALGVVQALNNSAPSMVSNMNLTLLKVELDKIHAVVQPNAIKSLRDKASIVVLTQQTTFTQFCAKICSKQYFFYAQQVYQQGKHLAFYDDKSAQHQMVIQQFNDKNYHLDPRDYCKDIYGVAVSRLKARLATKGKGLAGSQTTVYESFVRLTIKTAINAIPFQGRRSMPSKVRHAIRVEKHRLKREFLTDTLQMVDLPVDYLNLDVDKEWKSEIISLEVVWQTIIAKAKADRRKVTTTGDHVCPSCGAGHKPVMGHKKCGENALWYWVDAKSRYGVCDCCDELSVMSSVCCWDCSTTLNAKIITIQN